MIKLILKFILFNKNYKKKIEEAYKILNKSNKIEKVYKMEELKNVKFNNVSIDNTFIEFGLNLNTSLRQFIYSKLINTPYFTSKLILL